MEKLKRVISSAIIPPAAAKGTLRSTSPESLALEKSINKIINIIATTKFTKRVRLTLKNEIILTMTLLNYMQMQIC